MGWAIHVQILGWGERETPTGFWWGNPKVIGHLEGLAAYSR
jgi:hypothetical protein